MDTGVAFGKVFTTAVDDLGLSGTYPDSHGMYYHSYVLHYHVSAQTLAEKRLV